MSSQNMYDNAVKDARDLISRISQEDYEKLKDNLSKKDFTILVFILRNYGVQFKGLSYIEYLVSELVNLKEKKQSVSGIEKVETEIIKYIQTFSNIVDHDFDGEGKNLLCELLIDNNESGIYFYIHTDELKELELSGKSYKFETLRSWLQRPFPLYLMIYAYENKKLYWKSIEKIRSLIQKKISTLGDAFYIDLKDMNILDKKLTNELIENIYDDIGFASMRWVPTRYEYQNAHFTQLNNRELFKIKEEIIKNLHLLLFNYINLGRNKETLILCELLTKLDPTNFVNYIWFGQICKKTGKIEKAKFSFERALKLSKLDTEWLRKNKNSNKIIKYIKKELERLT